MIMKRHQMMWVCAFVCGGAAGCGNASEWAGEESVSSEQAEINLVAGLDPESDDRFGAMVAMGDFDANGFDDMVVSVTGQDVGAVAGAGMVVIQRGNTGLTLSEQVINPDTWGLQTLEGGVDFGRALGAGDFNGDGRDDLAIGTPHATVGSESHAGVVSVVYGGGGSALSGTGAQTIAQGADGMAGAPESLDFFGESLAVGDFDGDGFEDLAIGVPEEDIGDVVNVGAVHVVPGSEDGLLTDQSQIFYPGASGVAGDGEGNWFGYALTAGDLNNDGKDDLVVGIPLKVVDGTFGGMIHVFFGSSSLITTTGDFQLSQNSSGIAGSVESGDSFGWTLATGDFNGDSYSDIAVGNPSEDVGSASGAGSINIIFGSASGPTSTGNYVLHKDSSGVTGTASLGDSFGYALSSGDYNNDGWADLAVSSIETVNGEPGAGAVYVFLGANAGPSGSTDSLFSQETQGIDGGAEWNDHFGEALASGDFNGDGYSDLLVGVPWEEVSSEDLAGAAHVLLGSSSGITGSGSYLFTK
jgi:hypothetical protein